MIATGAAEGPFAILDTIGIDTVYNITLAKANATGNPDFEKLAHSLKTEYLDTGKHGKATGQGFYTYPNPSFARPDFLRNR
jgi:3-hydroxybutyryl-CoA dehydrogenase